MRPQAPPSSTRRSTESRTRRRTSSQTTPLPVPTRESNASGRIRANDDRAVLAARRRDDPHLGRDVRRRGVAGAVRSAAVTHLLHELGGGVWFGLGVTRVILGGV